MWKWLIYSLMLTTILSGSVMAQFTITSPIYVSQTLGNDANDGLTPATAKATVIAGIAAAGAGNAGVRIAAGTYQENNLTISGKTLQGGWDATFTTYNPAVNVTILDGGYNGTSDSGDRLVRPSGACQLQGLTLRNANARRLGGVTAANDGGAILAGALTGIFRIDSCIFTGNVAHSATPGENCIMAIQTGGEIVEITNCTFTANGREATSTGEGTLIRIDTTNNSSDRAQFDNCTFSDNTFRRRLIFNDDGGNMTIRNCTFSGNITNNDDLIRERRIGVSTANATDVLLTSGCTFIDNVGNLIAVDDVNTALGSTIIHNNVITSNTFNKLIAMTNDASVSNHRVTFSNNTVSSNTFASQNNTLMGGTIRFVHNVFYGNSGTDTLLNTGNTGATAVSGFSAIAQNNIFSLNTGFTQGLFGSSATVANHWTNVSHSIFHGGNQGTTDNVTAITLDGRLTGNGNFDQDPLFVNAVGGNFHLQTSPESPAANAGADLSATSYNVALDIDNNARPFGLGYDIGVDESTIVPVELSAFGLE